MISVVFVKGDPHANHRFCQTTDLEIPDVCAINCPHVVAQRSGRWRLHQHSTAMAMTDSSRSSGRLEDACHGPWPDVVRESEPQKHYLAIDSRFVIPRSWYRAENPSSPEIPKKMPKITISPTPGRAPKIPIQGVSLIGPKKK